MKRIAVLVIGFLLVTGLQSRAELPTSLSTTQPSTQPTSYKIERFSKKDPKWEGFVVRIDLTDPKLKIAVGVGGPDPDDKGIWETILQPTTVISKANSFDLAINTVFFSVNRERRPMGLKYAIGDWAASTSLVMSDGKMLSLRREGMPIMFDEQNRASIGTLNVIPKEARVIVSGNKQIVFRGQVVDKIGDNDRAPRSSIGIADKGKTLVLFVVDGRRDEWSVGMSLTELAATMIDFGCESALNLDGGGSTTLVIRKPTPAGDQWKVVNTPSDGSESPIPLSIERPVPYVLGFRWE